MSTNPYAQMVRRQSATGDSSPNQKIQTARELESAIGKSSDVLMRATAVFPLVLFPDTVTIDRTKLTITHREFFKAAEVLSISLDDILNVTASVGPFFGNIKIATRFFDPDKPYTVEHFWRADALKIKRVAQGCVIARQRKIDTSALSTQELAATLDRLGKVGPEEKV